MRPPGPLPVRPARSRPASRASLRASGLAKSRSPRPPPAAAGVVAVGVDAGATSATAGSAVAAASPDAATTPIPARKASRSATVSPTAAYTAIGEPTSTRLPSATSWRRITPSVSASTSTTALSVSIVTIASPAANSSPTATIQVERTASVASAAISGIRRISARPSPAISRSLAATSSLRAMAARSSTLLMLGDASPPVTRSTGWSSQSKKRRWISSDSQPPYDVPHGALLDDEHVVRLPDALADGVPVDAGPVEPAQVDDLGVRTGLLDGVEDEVRHHAVGEDREQPTRRRTAALPTGR